jgi:hypothetical protein
VIVSSVIAALAVVLSALILRKVQKVHVLVNSRMDATLAEIADLKKQRDAAQVAAQAPDQPESPSEPSSNL